MDEGPRNAPSLAWSLGCVIWKIFNPEEEQENFQKLENIPSELNTFYKKCLSRKVERRPKIDELQAFLLVSFRFGSFFTKVIRYSTRNGTALLQKVFCFSTNTGFPDPSPLFKIEPNKDIGVRGHNISACASIL